jgi:hypothetical protein
MLNGSYKVTEWPVEAMLAQITAAGVRGELVMGIDNAVLAKALSKVFGFEVSPNHCLLTKIEKGNDVWVLTYLGAIFDLFDLDISGERLSKMFLYQRVRKL